MPFISESVNLNCIFQHRLQIYNYSPEYNANLNNISSVAHYNLYNVIFLQPKLCFLNICKLAEAMNNFE